MHTTEECACPCSYHKRVNMLLQAPRKETILPPTHSGLHYVIAWNSEDSVPACLATVSCDQCWELITVGEVAARPGCNTILWHHSHSLTGLVLLLMDCDRKVVEGVQVYSKINQSISRLIDCRALFQCLYLARPYVTFLMSLLDILKSSFRNHLNKNLK